MYWNLFNKAQRALPGVRHPWPVSGILLCCAVWGCGSEESLLSDNPVVYVVGVENLSQFAVRESNVYQPDQFVDLDSAHPEQGRAAGFVLTVTGADTRSLHLQLKNQLSGNLTDLQRIPPRAAAPAPPPQTWILNPTLQQMLRSGQGAYWINGTELSVGPEYCRIYVAISEALLQEVSTLLVYDTHAEDGSPLGAAHLELVPGFFYVATIGDSVINSNGLIERQKVTSLVAEYIQTQTGHKAVRRTYAVSGAEIQPRAGERDCISSCGGEVPRGDISLTTQALIMEHPELLDLVVVGGCLNDVSLSRLFSYSTTTQEVEELTRLHCGEHMVELLSLIRELAPQARIVVTGYYVPISMDSDTTRLQSTVRSLSLPFLQVEDIQSFLEAGRRNFTVFRETAHASMSAAVEMINAEAGVPVAAFADPRFGPQNAAMAPDAWLWGLSIENPVGGLLADLQLFPEDPLWEYRLRICLQPGITTDPVTCIYASVGHPNPSGARAYRDAIIDALDALGGLDEMPH